MKNLSGPPKPTTPTTPPDANIVSNSVVENTPPISPPVLQSPPSVLPPEETINPDVGLWGPSDAGKIILLAAALQKLRSEVGYPNGNPRPTHFYQIETEPGHSTQGASQEFLDKISADFAEGSLPFGTVPNNTQDAKPFVLRLSYKDITGDGRIGRFHRLSFMDVAGENTSNTEPKGKHPYWENLRQARGILFVVDGDRTKTHYNNEQVTMTYLISNFLSRMNSGAGGLQDKFIAICVTKVDMMYPSASEVPTEDADRENVLRSLIPNSIQALLEPFRERSGDHRYRIFLTSGIGWYLQDGKSVPNFDKANVKDKKMLNSRAWHTYHAVYPLLWLFDRIEQANIQKHRLFLRKFVSDRRITNVDILTATHGNTHLP